MEDDEKAAAKGDLRAMETRLNENISEAEDRLMEAMRDMQTEVLRAFASFAEGQNIRLRKLEADHSNLDTAAMSRLAVVEKRLLEIEMKLHIEPPSN